MKKSRHYYCEMFGMNYYFLIGWPAERAAKYLKKYFKYEGEFDAAGKTVLFGIGGSSGIAIWTKPGDRIKDVLVHECVHAANFTLNHVGVEACHENDETLAYLTGLIFKKALE